MDSLEDHPSAPPPDLSKGLFWLGCVALLVAYVLVCRLYIHEMPLIDPDEPRYASAGRTMAEGGSLLIPEFNGEPRINKPPLFYWLVAASNKLFGPPTETFSEELIARLPSMLMGVLMLAVTIFSAAKIFGRRTALLAGAILSTMPLFMALSRTCITDMTLSSFLCGALALLMLVMTEKIPRVHGIWAAAVVFGLAILTKATPALALVLVVLIDRALSLPALLRPKAAKLLPFLLVGAMALSFAAVRFSEAGKPKKVHAAAVLNAPAAVAAADGPDDDGDDESSYQFYDMAANRTALSLIGVFVLIIAFSAGRAGLGPLRGSPWLLGLITAMLMGLWWYGALIKHFGWERFNELLKVEVAGRLAGTMHREPMHYYVPQFLGLAFPWSIGLIGALAGAWPRESDPERDTSERKADRFLLAWTLGIVLFFSIPGAKLATYVLAAMPPAAILIARFIRRLGGEGRPVSGASKLVTFLGILAAGGGLAFLALKPGVITTPHPEFGRLLAETMSLSLLAGLLFVGFCGSWLMMMWGHWRLGVPLSVLTTLAMIFICTPPAMPNFENRSTRRLCRLVKAPLQDVIKEGRVASVGAESESLTYYLESRVYESRRRRLVSLPLEPGQEPVTKDEPFDAVVLEELARPEKVALFIQKRYFARMLGIDRKAFDQMKRPEVIASVPPEAQFVDMDDDIIVIRNLR